MSLLPIIYTSLLIFSGLVTTVLLVSYIIYKVKGGGPKPALENVMKPANNYRPSNKNLNIVYNSQSNDIRKYRTSRPQNELMIQKKPISIQSNQPVRRKSTTPRIQIINKPTEKKIVVVKKSVNQYNDNDANNFLGYYHENERGVLFQA